MQRRRQSHFIKTVEIVHDEFKCADDDDLALVAKVERKKKEKAMEKNIFDLRSEFECSSRKGLGSPLSAVATLPFTIQ